MLSLEIYSKKKLDRQINRNIILFIMVIVCQSIYAQIYYACGAGGLYEISINGNNCGSSYIGDFINTANGNFLGAGDIAVCPNGNLYITDNINTYQVDPSSGACTQVATASGSPIMVGLCCSADNELYGMGLVGSNTSLYQIDVINGSTVSLGNIPYFAGGDLVFYNGELYMSSADAIIHVNIGSPSASTILWPSSSFIGMTVLADECNSLVGSNGGLLTKVDLGTGDLTFICNVPVLIGGLTTPSEFDPASTNCEFKIDLDFDDSSGLPIFDFKGEQIKCNSPLGVNVCDDDIFITAPFPISSITINLESGILDGAFEKLLLTNSFPGINVTGSGTQQIVLTNTGNANRTVFMNAIKSILYSNNKPIHSTGQRKIKVKGIDITNAVSEDAFAYIDIIALPIIPVNLGDDTTICSFTNLELNAGDSGTSYVWSDGSTANEITISEPGVYSVTVSDGIICPGIDTIEIGVNPQYTITLNANADICLGDQVEMVLLTNTNTLLDISIIDNNNLLYNFSQIANGYKFSLEPNESTVYLLQFQQIATPFECLVTDEDSIKVNVYSAIEDFQDHILCEGEAYYLQNNWYTSSGSAIEQLKTQYGCDSTVFHTFNFYNLDTSMLLTYTCNINEVGVFSEKMKSYFGCDSFVVTTKYYIAPDTSFVLNKSCNPNLTGVEYIRLLNTYGCDSLVEIKTIYVEADTTVIMNHTCVNGQQGIYVTKLQNNFGCDSLIIFNTTFKEPDTTRITTTTCIKEQQGTTIKKLSNKFGCDSILIYETKYLTSDTILIKLATCDSLQAGLFSQLLTNMNGCDSVINTKVVFVQSDTTFLQKKSCNPANTGLFTTILENYNGCDSVIITKVKYIEKDTSYLYLNSCDTSKMGLEIMLYQNSEGCDSLVYIKTEAAKLDTFNFYENTCKLASAGIFGTTYINKSGCDSLVIKHINYSPPDSLFLFSMTCDSTQIGIKNTILKNKYGCDSIIVSVVSKGPSDTLLLETKTCDIKQAGIFIKAIPGIIACDSIIINHVSYSPSDTLNLFSKTCDSLKSGIFKETLTGLGGCDSIVFNFVSYNKSDTLYISRETCDPNQVENSLTVLQSKDGCDSNVLENVYLKQKPTVQVINFTCNPNDTLTYMKHYLDTEECDSLVLYKTLLSNSDSCNHLLEKDVFPNVFTPNNDGQNDFFSFPIKEHEKIEFFKIYDRWGNNVFSKTHVTKDFTGWDGKMNGNYVGPGVYIYLLAYKTESSLLIYRTGSITLVE